MHRLQPLGADPLRAALASAVHRSGELRFIHRLHAVLLVSVGRSCYEVARWFGEDPRSIERWVHAYEMHGDSGLLEHQRSGRPARLSPQQLPQLALDLAGEPGNCGYPQARWGGKLLARHLERRYGVRLSLRQCQRLLQRAKRGSRGPFIHGTRGPIETEAPAYQACRLGADADRNPAQKKADERPSSRTAIEL